ncbi:subtilase-type protease inhibitor [Streptomyces humidus]|uniref:Probable subtilase-type protease inhibitor n=1 Tax=Streptomyces humidus TaxID=52259 RepID=A0A918G0L4_9ACTN|nr:subtilase-type protease inhibitor [Streptomyces humidus]GGS07279.1 subtilase-type protease inhibitor [Streptomyces humidus]
MRNTARWAATLGLTAVTVCGSLTGPALAAPAAAPTSLYAPSAFVLTVGHGDSAATVDAARAVTLNCAPTPSGTHPSPALACAELRAAGGDLEALAGPSGAVCTRQYDPVVVTVDGVWRGKRVAFERAFANECVRNAAVSSLFAF